MVSSVHVWHNWGLAKVHKPAISHGFHIIGGLGDQALMRYALISTRPCALAKSSRVFDVEQQVD